MYPGPPWPKIRGTGNGLRNQDDRIDIDTIGRTVAEDLPSLKTAVGATLQRLAG